MEENKTLLKEKYLLKEIEKYVDVLKKKTEIEMKELFKKVKINRPKKYEIK